VQPQDSSKIRMTVGILADPKQSDRILANLAGVVYSLSIHLRKRNRGSARKRGLASTEDA
jgi:hypothetical protein